MNYEIHPLLLLLIYKIRIIYLFIKKLYAILKINIFNLHKLDKHVLYFL